MGRGTEKGDGRRKMPLKWGGSNGWPGGKERVEDVDAATEHHSSFCDFVRGEIRREAKSQILVRMLIMDVGTGWHQERAIFDSTNMALLAVRAIKREVKVAARGQKKKCVCGRKCVIFRLKSLFTLSTVPRPTQMPSCTRKKGKGREFIFSTNFRAPAPPSSGWSQPSEKGEKGKKEKAG